MYTPAITGTGVFTPAERISNAELVQAFNAYVDLQNARHAEAIAAGEREPLHYSSEEFIEKASGIHSRFVMDKSGVLDPEVMHPQLRQRSDDEPGIMAEMALDACTKALAQAGVDASEVDLVICAASNHERAYPAIAVEIQQLLGAGGFAFDMNVACSSATFGIQAGVDAIRNGSARRVLMVNPEICSGHLAWEDRDCHFIFGDVATAVILERKEDATSDNQWEVLGTRLQTKFSNNIRNNFGFLNRADESGIGARDKLFRQEGRRVFKEVCPMVAEQISSHLSDTGVAVEALSRMWLHQANLSMNELISKRVLGRPATREEAPVILDDYANTSSAGSIIAFHKYNADLPVETKGVICSFGAGYSIGSVIVNRIK